jgi:hypothetical protein
MVAFPALVPAAASAHGRIPAPVSITRGPAGSNGLLIGTTFGGVISTDGGSSWRWICEESIGYGGNLDPAFVWSPAGTLFLPSYDGLYVSRDRGCSFDLHPSIGPNLSSAAAVDPRDANVIFATRVETMNDGPAVCASPRRARPTRASGRAFFGSPRGVRAGRGPAARL